MDTSRFTTQLGSPEVELLEPRLMLDGQAQALQILDASPALFVQNQGQWADTAIRYGLDGAGCAIAFRDSGLDFLVYRGQGRSAIESTGFSLRFDGARTVSPVGQDLAATTFNYLLGDQAAHRSNLPAYGVLSYQGIYDGIDLRTWGKRGGLKYEFDVAPGADYGQIQVRYDGIGGLSVDADGALHIQTALGEIVEAAPNIYQDVDGRQVAVAGGFKLVDADTYGFVVTGAYDAAKPLILDPDLSWLTYLQTGTGYDSASSVAVDSSGDVYVTGVTIVDGLATAGAYDTTCDSVKTWDVFVAKIDATGGKLDYFTYMGGTSHDYSTGIAVDNAGNAYVTGETASPGLATPGAYDTNVDPRANDAFVAKLNPTGTALQYYTYLGGSDTTDSSSDIALDGAGNAYITGYTETAGLATAGAYDTTFAGGTRDAFVAKMNATGTALAYLTYLGGTDADRGIAIAVDSSGSAYVTGTGSAGLATAGAYQTGGVAGDAFVAKLNASGSTLSYLTYLHGASAISSHGIALDAAGNAYLTGATSTPGLATPGAYDTTCEGTDAFVAKLNATGSGLGYFTYLGGVSSGGGGSFHAEDGGASIAVNANGNAYVTGWVRTPGLATAGAYQSTYGGGSATAGDAFVAKLSATGGELAYFSYLGGTGDDCGLQIVLGDGGLAYVTGVTSSAGLATPGAYNTAYAGTARPTGYATFVAKMIAVSAPGVVLAADPLPYTRNAVVATIDPALAVSGADDPGLASAKVWISGNYTDGQDVLAFTSQGGITGIWDESTGTLSLTGTATAAAYQAALRTVTYTCTSDSPSVLARTVSFQVSYAWAAGLTSSRTINVAASGPDLAASFGAVTVPVAVLGDKALAGSVSVVIKNVGRSPTAAGQKADIQIVARDAQGNDIPLAPVKTIALALAVNRSVTVPVAVSRPAGLPAETYQLLAIVTPTPGIAEWLTDNNTARLNAGAHTVGIVAATPFVDLVPTFGTLKLPTAAVVSGSATSISVPINVQNAGNVAVPAATPKMDVRVLARPTAGGPDVLLKDILGASVSALGAGKTAPITSTVRLPIGMPGGTYELVALIDTRNQIVETGSQGAAETNNEVVSAGTFTVTEGRPDLAATFGRVTLSAAIVSDKAITGSVPVVIKNLGNVATPARQTVNVQIIARDSQGHDTALTPVKKVPVNLIPNGSTTVPMAVSRPAGMPAETYQVLAVVTAAPALNEWLTDNNTATKNASGQPVGIVSRPAFVDLVAGFATTLKLPAAPTSGDGKAITVPVTVKNAGNWAVAAKSVIDIAIYARTSDGQGGHVDTLLKTLTGQSVAALAAGGTKTFSTSVKLPMGLAGGAYSLVAVIDTTGKVAESDDPNGANNTVVTAATMTVTRGWVDISGVFAATGSTLPTTVKANKAISGALPIVISNTGNLKMPTGQAVTVRVVAHDIATDTDVADLATTKVAVAGLKGSTTARISIKKTSGLPAGQYQLRAYLTLVPALDVDNPDNNLVLLNTLGLMPVLTVT